MQVGGRKLEFFTLEPVDGELLADRLQRGSLPAAELFRYAIDVGRSLQRAHSRLVVHGRLSSFAVVITPTGARILDPGQSPVPPAAAYRSPEQVRGEPADARADIFAYGALLYEMASGKRAFSGDPGQLDREILELPPVPSSASPEIADALVPVIAACLEKDVAVRRQRMQNAVLELRLRRPRILLRNAASLPPPVPAGPLAKSRRHGRLQPKLWLALAASVGLLSALAVASVLYLHRGSTALPLRYAISFPDRTTYGGSPSVSPDGRLVVFPAEGPDGQRMLWARSLESARSVPIAGTEGGSEPFWSPDGTSVAFFTSGALKRIRVDGGTPHTICMVAGTAGGGAWGPDGRILFAPSLDTGLFRVSADGGKPELALPLDLEKSQSAFLWPQFLPGGRQFLFFALTEDPRTTGVYAGSVGSPGYRFIFPSETNAVYSPAGRGLPESRGYLLFIRNRRLLGQPFETADLRVDGNPVTVADEIGTVPSLSLAPVSASRNATLAYQALGKPVRQLVWIDRAGIRLAAVREFGEWGPPRISPDGLHGTVAKLDPDLQTADLWSVDTAGAITQMTNTPAYEGSPVWSPDGARIASFVFGRLEGNYDLYTRRVDGRGEPELLFRDPRPKYPTDWSSDGRFLLFTRIGEATRSDVWAFSTAEHKAGPILDSLASEESAALSPDSKWLAFQSDESGTVDVYVQSFDGLSTTRGKRWKVAASAGLPRWRRDGSELFYSTSSGRMMSVAVHPEGREFAFDPPRLLFQIRPAPQTWNLYDVSPDGQRFLITLPLEWSNGTAITVLTNWAARFQN